MARSEFYIDEQGFDKLVDAMANYPDYAGQAIDDVLHNAGAELIMQGIQQFLPESGRTWKGKKPAAKRAAPFTQINEVLAVIVKSKTAYNYLYFPDDGSNTRNHAGNQQFMLRGAELEQEDIIDLCIGRLTQPFN